MKPGNRFAMVNNGANAVPPMRGNDKKLRPLLTEEVFFLGKHDGSLRRTDSGVDGDVTGLRPSSGRIGGPAQTCPGLLTTGGRQRVIRQQP